MVEPQDLKEILKQRFKELPPPVQRAIVSEDISKNLRQLSDTRKLHLDQWEKLENEVMMALFGITPIDSLQEKIQKEVGVSAETAAELSADISHTVFEPIRQELERELEHPEAKAKEMTGVETAREQALAGKPVAGSPEPVASGQPVAESQQLAAGALESVATGYKLQAASSVIPATPPPPPPTERAIRAPSSGAYKTGEASTLRRDIADDPYRETPQ